jgi:hypothetical protein
MVMLNAARGEHDQEATVERTPNLRKQRRNTQIGFVRQNSFRANFPALPGIGSVSQFQRRSSARAGGAGKFEHEEAAIAVFGEEPEAILEQRHAFAR